MNTFRQCRQRVMLHLLCAVRVSLARHLARQFARYGLPTPRQYRLLTVTATQVVIQAVS